MQYGFYFDADRCGSCKACVMACRDKNDTLLGLKNRNVIDFGGGRWVEKDGLVQPENVFVYSISISCNHCESPACVANCPTGAMYKDTDGTVQHDDEACIGCQTCVNSCPYGAPQFIEEDKIVQKCDTCRALREAGMNPVCVDACPMRAIEFGDMDELRAAHPNAVSELPCTEAAATTGPNILWEPTRGAQMEAFEPVTL